MDLGRPKNQSSQNQIKPTPLRPSCSADSDHIHFFSNKHCMGKLLHSDKIPKHEKSQQSKSMMMSAIQHVTSSWHHHADMVSPKGDTCHSNSVFLGWVGTCMDLTHGTVWMTCGSPYMMWPNGRMTRGSTDDSWVVRVLTWKDDCAVRTWHGTICGCMVGDVAGDWDVRKLMWQLTGWCGGDMACWLDADYVGDHVARFNHRETCGPIKAHHVETQILSISAKSKSFLLHGNWTPDLHLHRVSATTIGPVRILVGS